MKTLCLLCALFSGVVLSARGQGSAGTDATVEPRYLVDIPTAGMMSKGSLAVDLEFYQQGGILGGLAIGVLERLTIGLSYGGTHLIGSDEPVMNKAPGVLVKVRLVDESEDMPAIVIGFDSQGRDGFIDSLDRYAIKSPGFFASTSRNYDLLGSFGFHAGVNYSLERDDGDEDINVFAGVEKSIGSVVSLLAEYNLGLNDSEGKAIGRGRGYLNLGFRWSLGSGLTIGFNIKDMLKNAENDNSGNRTVRLEYSHAF